MTALEAAITAEHTIRGALLKIAQRSAENLLDAEAAIGAGADLEHIHGQLLEDAQQAAEALLNAETDLGADIYRLYAEDGSENHKTANSFLRKNHIKKKLARNLVKLATAGAATI